MATLGLFLSIPEDAKKRPFSPIFPSKYIQNQWYVNFVLLIFCTSFPLTVLLVKRVTWSWGVPTFLHSLWFKMVRTKVSTNFFVKSQNTTFANDFDFFPSNQIKATIYVFSCTIWQNYHVKWIALYCKCHVSKCLLKDEFVL